MIKGICFDLDGVYFVKGKQRFIESLTELGVSEDEARRVFLQSDEMNELYKEGHMTDDEYWSWAATEWGIDKSVKELTDLLIKGYEEDSEVLHVIKKLRGNGYKTLICSNNFPARINGLHKKFNFLDNFDAVVLSYQVGVRKPHSEIFFKLIEESGLTANEIVFADDHEANIDAAKSLGITAFHYENFKQFKNKLVELGVKI